ncbi:MAG TPA: DinB family protein [Sediminibacterium sp.]|nr:DinB family protein [Sediminibacterium sp.]
MTHLEQFQKEFEQEAITTRKMLTRVPNDRYDWQPHPKSMTVRQLATHIAELPAWLDMTFKTEELDFAVSIYQPHPIHNTNELVAYMEDNFAIGRAALKEGSEDQLAKPWTLRNGEQVYSTRPKRDVLRMTLNQITHHRAQLGVYLRLLDVPIPGSYGPSADESAF